MIIIRIGDQDVDLTSMIEQGYRLFQVNGRRITFWRPLDGEDFEAALAAERAKGSDAVDQINAHIVIPEDAFNALLADLDSPVRPSRLRELM